jgi:Putative zinc-finger
MTGSTDPFQDRLNDYLDAELDLRERRALEAHLRDCESCRRTLDELRDIVSSVRELPALEPSPAVWESIRRGLRERSGDAGIDGRTIPVGFWSARLYPTLAVAAALLLAVGLWTALRSGDREAPPPADSMALANMVTDELRAAESHYDKAIGGLETIIAQNGGVLPPELAAVLNQNLDLIEGAIAESRAAMSQEPDSTVAQESLLEALRRKVSLLQNTILLINEIRKGQGENALDLIDEMRKTTSSPNPI